ncbi:MAG: LUD domain-containing protein [Verrucomicrobiales bacterium]
MDEVEEEAMSPGEREIFKAVEESLADLPGKTPLPEYEDAVCVASGRLGEGTPRQIFAANFEAVGGRVLARVEDLASFLLENDHGAGYCDPALKGAVGAPLEEAGLKVDYEYERDRCDEYLFGVTLASGAIAESGSVVLNDDDTSDRLAALTPWVHVAVLPSEGAVHLTIPDAIAALGGSPNVVWVTGPSKTADVEGILIEGVHGPGVQICLMPVDDRPAGR